MIKTMLLTIIMTLALTMLMPINTTTIIRKTRPDRTILWAKPTPYPVLPSFWPGLPCALVRAVATVAWATD